VRIVSWNLGANTTSRRATVHERAWHYLAALDPDVALLQEATPPQWARERWSIVAPASARWGSAIIARPELRLTPGPVDMEGGFREGVLLATADLELTPGMPLLLGSVHAVVGRLGEAVLAGYDAAAIKRPREPIPYPNDIAYAIYRERVNGRRFLVSGDWNIARLWDDHHRGTHEIDFFTRAGEDGWVECYRLFHETEGRTWFRGSDLPYQLDHAFCDAETAKRLRSCQIDPHPAESLGLSDHAPLILELAMDEAP
jgi:exonuclease III